jgi:hypothetical protein
VLFAWSKRSKPTLPLATLANKLLPDNKPLQEIPVTTPVRNKTWRKVVETLRPRERKKRRAREFDEIMRSSINDPVGDIATTNWAAVLSEVVARDQAHWRKDEIMSSQDALDFTGLQEEIDDDEITALPPLPAQPQKKKEKKMPKEAESTML